MRDRLIELLQKRSCFYNKSKCNARCSNCDYVTIDDNDIGKLADHLLANGVIHIPCKIGDIVYQTDGLRIYELTILDISLRKNKPYYETESIDFDDDAFGKSIFLTEEEAERALKGGE